MSDKEKNLVTDLREYLLSQRRAITEDQLNKDIDDCPIMTGYYLAYGEVLKKFCGVTIEELFKIALRDKEEREVKE